MEGAKPKVITTAQLKNFKQIVDQEYLKIVDKYMGLQDVSEDLAQLFLSLSKEIDKIL